MLAGLKFVPREKLDKVIPVTFLFCLILISKELCVLFLLNFGLLSFEFVFCVLGKG